ncbi:hypothetical protein SOVF_088370 [Spinacia oleracea]|nr:hypothetical protein SOVF_088370 [Spinacia oleracea]
MDDEENNSRYIPKAYDLNNQQEYGSSLHPKVSGYDATYPGNEEEDLEDEELGEEEVETNGVRMLGKDIYGDEEEDEDDSDDDEEEEEDNDEHDDGKSFNVKVEDNGNERPQKKRKLRTLVSNYEFAPRLPTPTPTPTLTPNPNPNPTPTVRKAVSGQNSVGEWTERETFALLDAWGERFLRLGRKSLRSEEWKEVAEKVSQETDIERTNAQCRNRLDTLKKKYKKENTRLTAGASGGGGGGGSKWVFYRRMDMLMSSPPKQQTRTGLSCGIDSGEYVFMNPNVYLNHANGLDEMRDSPGNSDSDDSGGFPPKGSKNNNKGRRAFDGSSVKLLADSIEKFSEIYEKIESNKRKQMTELENMRMDFQRQLETQRREILERAQAEIAKIRQGDDNDSDNDDDNENDLSAENLSG